MNDSIFMSSQVFQHVRRIKNYTVHVVIVVAMYAEVVSTKYVYSYH